MGEETRIKDLTQDETCEQLLLRGKKNSEKSDTKEPEREQKHEGFLERIASEFSSK